MFTPSCHVALHSAICIDDPKTFRTELLSAGCDVERRNIIKHGQIPAYYLPKSLVDLIFDKDAVQVSKCVEMEWPACLSKCVKYGSKRIFDLQFEPAWIYSDKLVSELYEAYKATESIESLSILMKMLSKVKTFGPSTFAPGLAFMRHVALSDKNSVLNQAIDVSCVHSVRWLLRDVMPTAAQCYAAYQRGGRIWEAFINALKDSISSTLLADMLKHDNTEYVIRTMHEFVGNDFRAHRYSLHGLPGITKEQMTRLLDICLALHRTVGVHFTGGLSSDIAIIRADAQIQRIYQHNYSGDGDIGAVIIALCDGATIDLTTVRKALHTCDHQISASPKSTQPAQNIYNMLKADIMLLVARKHPGWMHDLPMEYNGHVRDQIYAAGWDAARSATKNERPTYNR